MDIIDILLAMKVSGSSIAGEAAGAGHVIAYMAEKGWVAPVMASDNAVFTDGKNIFVW